MVCEDSKSVLLFGSACGKELVFSMTNLLKDVFCVHRLDVVRFADSEIKVKIPINVRGKNVFIIQPTGMPTENYFELLIAINAAKLSSAKDITAVIPYFGFGRQDQKSESREPITASLIANFLQVAGATRVVSLDFHAGQVQGFFHSIPSDNLRVQPTFANKIKDMFSDVERRKLCFVSPDVGGVKRSQSMAKIFDSPVAIFTKDRDTLLVDTVNGGELIGNVNGKNCIIIDDLTSTMSSAILAAKKLQRKGAKTVSFFVSHFVCDQKTINKIQKQVHEIIFLHLVATNTHPNSALAHQLGFEIINLGKFWAEVIQRIERGKSLSELFKTNF